MALALHALAWRIAAAGLPRFAPAAVGVHRIALVSVPQPAGRTPPTAAPIAPKPVQMPAPDAGRPFKPPRAGALARVTPGARADADAGAAGRAQASGTSTSRRPDGATSRAIATGAGGTRRAAPAGARDWPVYPTRPPPSTTLRYALVQSGVASAATGSAALEWRRDGADFSLHLAVAAGERAPREWQSTGTFDAAGVAPLRLVERERGHDKRALQFDRDAGRVHFSGASGAPAMARGAQDRWSWIAQLAAIAEARSRRGAPPDHWDLQVAGLRGDVERWTFRVLPAGDPPPELQGNDLSTPGERAPALLHVLRATEQPYDLRIEAWLSPALHHLPAGLRMSTPPGPWSLSLWQRRS